MASNTSPLPLTPPATLNDTTTTAGLLHGLFQAFSLIIFSEIGDKTFLIAAILAMRHPRLVVFLGAFASLALMSVLSAEMGHLLPALLPRQYTQFAAAVLFLIFGAKMLAEARAMKGGSGKIKQEMKEAEEEIEEDDAAEGPRLRMVPLEDMEEGHSRGVVAEQGPEGKKEGLAGEGNAQSSPRKARTSCAEGARNFCSLFLGPVFVQAFVLTFLGEWGDRSQIATIALGAAHVCTLPLAAGSLYPYSIQFLDFRTCTLWLLEQ
jgi:putative Ca2+/H+ antiporter (TMEM165/GDT1 family)